MGKKVIYYEDERGRNPVWEFIEALPDGDRAKCFEYIMYLEEFGEQVRRPVGDYLGNKLYELRPRQTRIIYFFMYKDYAVLVHAFRKKTKAIPVSEMKIALSRMNEIFLKVQSGLICMEDDRK